MKNVFYALPLATLAAVSVGFPVKTASAALAVSKPAITELGVSAMNEAMVGKSGEEIAASLSILEEIDRLVPVTAVADTETAMNEGAVEFEEELAQNGSTKRKVKKVKPGTKTKASAATARPVTAASRSVAKPKMTSLQREEDRGRQAVRRGDYPEASRIFFNLLSKEGNPERLLQMRFILGRTLQEMGLHQAAAFPYYEIIRTEGKRNPKNRYVRQSLERLTVAADALESDILLSYALKQINEDDVPVTGRDMLFYRRGEVKFREGSYIDAAREFNRVRTGSTFYPRARYRLALSLVEGNQLDRAEQIFSSIASNISEERTDAVTNKNRVNALLGKARVLYQRKMFADAIDAYREIPRDTEQWHDSLFETSWAMLQDGRFRSALSNFHSLHSPFYEEFYQPESLLLRSIVYHYICRYDEMEKTLGLFERIYGPVQREMRSTLLASSSPGMLYRDVRKVDENFDEMKKKPKRQGGVPFLVARQILREGDIRRSLQYIHNLEQEKRRIDQAPANWRSSGIGRYSARIVEKRNEATQIATGRLVKRHLDRIQRDLAGHFEQAGLIRLDMLSGKKEAVKKEIAGKGLVREKVDESQDRSFYIQNGYDYWPFKGEYWLDEIGNYHYVGVKACE